MFKIFSKQRISKSTIAFMAFFLCISMFSSSSLSAKTAGPEGTEIYDSSSGLKIIIPPGALGKATDITVEIIAQPGINNKTGFIHMDVYKISPSDLSLKKEILIYFPTVKYKGVYIYRLKKLMKGNIFTPLIPDDTVGNITEELKIIPDKSLWEEFSADTSQKGYVMVKTKSSGIYTAGYFR
jgi:hypothetical protein